MLTTQETVVVSPERAEILIIDANGTVDLWSTILPKRRFTISVVPSRDEALAITKKRRPSAVLIALGGDDEEGYELCRLLKSRDETREIPVLFCSGEEMLDKSRLFELGAVDYVTNPIVREELLARIQNQIKSARLRREVIEQEAELAQLREALLESQRREEELRSRLRSLEATDPLTGVAVRRRFHEVLELEWKRGARTRDPLSLLLVEIDYFRRYQDAYGREAAERVLGRVAGILRDSLQRAGDFIARFGNETFALVLPSTTLENATSFAQGLRLKIEQLGIPNEQAKHLKRVTVSIGVAAAQPTEQLLPTHIMGLADQAMQLAHKEGGNRVRVVD